jgi:hypothetical protein
MARAFDPAVIINALAAPFLRVFGEEPALSLQGGGRDAGAPHRRPPWFAIAFVFSYTCVS